MYRIAGKTNLFITNIEQDIASALYEVSYLNALNNLENIVRWEKEKFIEKKKSGISDGKKTQNTYFLNNLNDRQKILYIMKNVARCMSVCWTVCEDILHQIKIQKLNVRLNISEEKSKNNPKKEEILQCNLAMLKEIEMENTNNCEIIFDENIEILVNDLLHGFDESMFKPAVCFSFNAPPHTRTHKTTEHIPY